jgi:hypothetical protein
MYLRKNGNIDDKMRNRDDYSEYELVNINFLVIKSTSSLILVFKWFFVVGV